MAGAGVILAVSLRTPPRAGHIQNGLIVAAIAAAAVAVVPIAMAIVGGPPAVGHVQSAFASAPSGEYAVVSRSNGAEDVIAVVPASNPAQARDVAHVAHVAGYAPVGSVSPDGRQLALVVAESGPQAAPAAALQAIELETGATKRLAEKVDVLRTPVWAPDSRSVVITRGSSQSGDGSIHAVRVFLDGSAEQEVLRVAWALGAYPVGFDRDGHLISVVIDSRGSSLVRDDKELGLISSQITRDWRLSPDASQLAFVESDVRNGLQYRGRVVDVDAPENAQVTGQALRADGQQLGVAWQPGAVRPTFGEEPGAQRAVAAPASAQALEAQPGFDVPLAYSAGGVLAVTHWTGTGFADAGRSMLELVSPAGRSDLPGFSRFFGWTQR